MALSQSCQLTSVNNGKKSSTHSNKIPLFKRKKTQEINDELDSVCREASPSFATVENWVAEYKRGRTSVFDECSGSSKIVITDDRIDLVQQTVMEYRRLTVEKIAEACGILSEWAHKI